jgi:membrane-associated protein
MQYGTFFRYNVVGGVVWGAGIVTAGYILGDTIPNIDKYLLPIIFVIILLSLIPPLLEWRRHRKQSRVDPATDTEPA